MNPASRLVLKTDSSTITADGRDMAIVTIEVQDKKGRQVPDACPMLTFSVEGEGCIIGAGNGDPSYPGKDNPGSTTCREFSIPAFNGLAQILVQSTANAGRLTLRASADGIATGSIVVESR